MAMAAAANPREVAKAKKAAPQEGKQAAATSRGRRLGKGARRDIRWALRQHPGDNVRDIMLHGVRISFHTTQGPTDKDDAHDDTRRVDRNEAVHDHSDENTLNSKQRRSRRRAKKYYGAMRAESERKAAAAEQDANAAVSPPPRPTPPAGSAQRPSPDSPTTSQAQPHADTTPSTSQAQPHAKGSRRDNDDVSMTDAPGSGRGQGGKPRKGRGRGGN